MAASDGEPMVAPTPRSPPKYPDFCGRRRLQLEVQILNREVGFLEEELQSLEGLQPVSRCCKEVNEFVGTNPDPLVPPNKKRRSSCRFWRWLGSKLCACFSCICCCTGCCHQCKKPSCSCCPNLKNLCCCNCHCDCLHCCYPEVSCCRLPRSCCQLPRSCCCWKTCCCCKLPTCCSWNPCCCKPPKCCSCRETSCCKMPKCCCSPTVSCPEYSCGCVFDCPKCNEVHLCPKCSRPCCVTGCLC